MAGRKKTETVEAEVVETAVVPAGKMEFRLINPTEDGFLRRIQWNKEELEAAVRAKIAGYENVVYTEENIKAAKNDRAELNKLIKAIEERRKQVKNLQKKRRQKRTTESREIHRPRNLTRKSRRILQTTSWAMQTQKVTITKIRRSRYGTDETKSEQLCGQRQ